MSEGYIRSRIKKARETSFKVHNMDQWMRAYREYRKWHDMLEIFHPVRKNV